MAGQMMWKAARPSLRSYSTAATATPAANSTRKLAALRAIERKPRAHWRRIFEQDAPSKNNNSGRHGNALNAANNHPRNKFLVTFPFPYMNGRLHLGHAFTLSKAEFQARYQRQRGRRVLFPFGFHGTGMPIRAAADKLARELAVHGTEVVEEAAAGTQSAILRQMGIATEEIAAFADPQHWLDYFPPKAKSDLERLGLSADWRRSFMTTDRNAHFSAFVRWQFNRLKEMDLVKFGRRYTIWSPSDGQPCLDHDRQTGEGVRPQEWTLIKMRVREWPAALRATLSSTSEPIYLAAATLRPETMYGQTNVWLHPRLQYGFYRVQCPRSGRAEVWVCTERAARNLAHQLMIEHEKDITKEGERTPLRLERIHTAPGQELIGCLVDAPLSKYGQVRALPMDSISGDKGTGVVTSVPGDSPDDYVNWLYVRKKAEYLGVRPEWIEPYAPVPIIECKQLGENGGTQMIAQHLVEQLKIQSPKDASLLAEAKERAYKEGYYGGRMLVGAYCGRPVQEAKALIREQMVENGEACAYWEPEKRVVSRSGDECVVSLSDQWYLNYGVDTTWKQRTQQCLEKLEVFHPECRRNFEATLDWLREWACARTYGLGTRLPWDDRWMIESLSDSTIYPAYYTVSHLVERYPAEAYTDAVWDYIMRETVSEPPSGCQIPVEALDEMRREFQYFYPVDLRVSGKDLISNHLTFYLYNHTAIWSDAQDKWPRAVRANGHLLLNGEKMSKSTGNFMTLADALDKYGADATRLALAEAGDGIEDANFEEERANAAILKLFNLKEWIESLQMTGDSFPKSNMGAEWPEQVLLNEMRQLARLTTDAYEKMMYYEVVKSAFHGMLAAKDFYLLYQSAMGRDPNQALLRQFITVQTQLLNPITPHFSDFMWSGALKNREPVETTPWPELVPEDPVVLAQKSYLENLLRDIRLEHKERLRKSAKKSKQVAPVETQELKGVDVYVARSRPEWQQAAVDALRELGMETLKSMDMNRLSKHVSAQSYVRPHLKNKKLMPFVKLLKTRVDEGHDDPLASSTAFDELAFLRGQSVFIKSVLGVESLQLRDARDDPTAAKVATPGQPFLKLA